MKNVFLVQLYTHVCACVFCFMTELICALIITLIRLTSDVEACKFDE